MRKAPIWIIAIAFISIFSTQISFAAVTSGAKCSKAGAVATTNGKKYKCIKSGNKLVWNKGVALPKPTPKVTPTAIGDPEGAIGGASTPTPTPTPTPTSVPVPPEPKTFDDLISNPESVTYWAWQKSNLQFIASTADGPKANVILGPHTLLPNNLLQSVINFDSKLYEGFAHPHIVITIYYNFEDISWAQQEWGKIALRPQGNEASRMCLTVDTCWGAFAEIDLKGNGLIMIASKNVGDSNHTLGLVEAHEYAHTIQSTQFAGTLKEENAYCCTKAYMPHWMVEGNAEFTQAAAVYATSYSAYLKERNIDTSELLTNANKVFTKEWFENYLDISKTIEWNKSENGWRMYDVGFLVNEVLASIKGPAINMELFKEVANGKTWDQAFETNFGISWAAALPKISTILYEMVSH